MLVQPPQLRPPGWRDRPASRHAGPVAAPAGGPARPRLGPTHPAPLQRRHLHPGRSATVPLRAEFWKYAGLVSDTTRSLQTEVTNVTSQLLGMFFL